MLAVALVGLGVPGSTLASDDTTPPVLSALSVSPGTVDVSSAAATVTVTATITDDLSGFQDGSLYFRSPSGNQSTAAGFPFFQPAGGDQYTATVTFPQYAEGGTWRVDFVFLHDNAGNYSSLSHADLQALGFDPTVTVTGTSDTQGPVLSALGPFDPTSIDVSSGPAPVTLTATITDDLSGFFGGDVHLQSPSRSYLLAWGYVERVGGDQYRATVTVPQYAEPGAWHVDAINLTDLAGNQRRYSRSDLQALGFDPTLNVTSSPSDTTAPVLSALSVAPNTIDVSSAGATVTVTATMTDDLVGVQRGWVGFESPSGQQHTFTYALMPIGGDQYEATVPFPQGAEAGSWHVWIVQLDDLLGNYRLLFHSDLQALGFDPTVTVRGLDTTPPKLETPAAFAVDATSANGAPVTYTVSATDDVDGQLTATCTPSSGSVFAIGTTTVHCTATDAAGNTASAQFNVHVRGAVEQLANFHDAVIGIGPDTSLVDKISDAQAALARNNVTETRSILTAFINQVKAQSGKSISRATATALITDATRIKAVLGSK